MAHFDEVEEVELERDTKLSLSVMMSRASRTRTTFNMLCGAIRAFADPKMCSLGSPNTRMPVKLILGGVIFKIFLL